MTSKLKSRGVRADFYYGRAIEISVAWLQELGVAGLLIDIDNTITRWEAETVPQREGAWLVELLNAGLKIRLLSNGLVSKKAKVQQQTGISHVGGMAVKPFAQAFQRGLQELGLPPGSVMMIGDSVFTDIIPANRMGIWTCLVEPLSPVDFMGSRVYRLLEQMLALRGTYLPEHDYRQPGRQQFSRD